MPIYSPHFRINRDQTGATYEQGGLASLPPEERVRAAMQLAQILKASNNYLPQMGPGMPQGAVTAPSLSATSNAILPGGRVRFSRGGRGVRRAQQPGDFIGQMSPMMQEQVQIKRQGEYLSRFLRTMATQFGGRLKPAPYGFDDLRALARRHPLLTAIISTRLHQLRWVCTPIDDPTSKDQAHHYGFSVVHKHHFDRDFTVSKDIKKRCARVLELLTCPHGVLEKSFLGFMGKLLQDHLILDRAVIEIMRGSDSTPAALATIDGATILPLDFFLRAWCQQNYGQADPPPMDEIYNDVFRQSYFDISDASHIQIVDGMLANVFSEGDLLVGISNPSSDVYHYGFGVSLVEAATPGAVDWLNAYSYNSLYWKQGITTDVILTMQSEIGMDDPAVAGLEEALSASHMGVENAHRLPVIGLDPDMKLEAVQLKNSAREMEYFKALHFNTMLLLAIFRMDPQEINIPDKFQGTGALSAPSREMEIALAEEQGLHSILKFFDVDLLTPIIQQMDPDLKFLWIGLEKDKEETQVELRTKRCAGWQKINEAREEEGKESIKAAWAELPTPLALIAYQVQVQKEMQEDAAKKQAAQGMPPGIPGQPGGMPGQPGQKPGGPPGAPGGQPGQPPQGQSGGKGQQGQQGQPPQPKLSVVRGDEDEDEEDKPAKRSAMQKALEVPELWAPISLERGDEPPSELFIY